jgi:hypothetical protein
MHTALVGVRAVTSGGAAGCLWMWWQLTTAPGCSVVDLTGQRYLPHDRASADAQATPPAVGIASSGE